LNSTGTDYKIFEKPKLTNPTLLVCWDDEAGGLGTNVFNHLSSSILLTPFAEIEPTDYFSLSGVAVERDIALFPESKFFHSQEKNLVIFKSSLPRNEWHRFVNSVLEIAETVCGVKQIITIGGMVAMSSHTTPRVLMATVNDTEVKASLNPADTELTMNYETPIGQRPTMSSYLLWAAIQRKMAGISLWVPVPFYLVNVDDFRACRRLLEFIDQKLQIGLNMKNINEATSEQNKKIIEILKSFPELIEIFQKLETNITLSQSETSKIIEIVEERLK
jgi:proteasome assembly chaperone (PAC2) family protein